VGIVRPYPAEWDTTPYPLRFKAPTPHTFDGIGSLNQHIYYFKSQTGNIVSNDAIMARLFIGTLKGVAFEWFMKLPAGSIKAWAELKKTISNSLLQRRYRGSNANSPYHEAEERRVHQSFCREILEYDTPLSKWHIAIHTGGNMPSQPTDYTPRPYRSGGILHLKTAGATRRAGRGNSRQGQG